jgi:hypothetical protein
MTTIFLRHQDCLRRVHKKANAAGFNFPSQIAPAICTVEVTKRVKPDTTFFESRRSRLSLICHFIDGHALPLSKLRFLRLAQISPMLQRSPARRSSDDRAVSSKTAGEMSRGIAAQLPGNSRAAANAVPPGGLVDDSQDNSQHDAQRLGNIRVAASATRNAAPCETSRELTRRDPAVMFSIVHSLKL